MAIKQIGELGTLNTIPVNSQVVIENNNDANVVSVETLVTALGRLNVPELATSSKTIIDALNELNDRIKVSGAYREYITESFTLRLRGKMKFGYTDTVNLTTEEVSEDA